MPPSDRTTTQNTSSQPWAAAQPALKTAIGGAESLYNSGVGSNPYPNSTVVPLSDPTLQGLNQMTSAGNAWWPRFSKQFGNVVDVSNQGGLNDLQRSSVAQLQPMASGEMLVKNNPFTDAVVNKQADLIQNRLAEQAGAMGRYGSGTHQALLTRELGDLANQAYSQDYNRERQYMQDAIGSVFNAGQQQYANQLNNTTALSNAYQAAMLPSQTLMQAGSSYEDLQGRQINDQIRQWEGQQNASWARLASLNSIASGAGALGGTSYGTAQQPSNSNPLGFLPLLAGLGGAIF